MTASSDDSWRVARLLFAVSARRWKNRVLLRMFPRRSPRRGEPARRPTPRKGPRWGVLGIVLGVVTLLGVTAWYVGLVGRLSQRLDRPESDDVIAIRRGTYEDLRRAEAAVRAERSTRPADETRDEEGLRREALDRAVMPFWVETHTDRHGRDNARAVRERLESHYLRRGLGGFQSDRRQDVSYLLGRHAWSQATSRRDMERALALTGLVLFAMLLFKAFSAANADLKDPTWDLEWLLAFPVATRGVFLARILHVSVLNAFSWLFLFPFFVVALLSASRPVLAVPVAAVATLLVNLFLGSLQVLGETFLRQTLSRARLSNVLGVCTILQMLLLLAILSTAAAPEATGALVAIARRLPDGLLYFPACLPLALCERGPAGWALLGLLAAGAVALAVLSAGLCQRMVQGGLTKPSGTGERRRRPAETTKARPLGLVGGMLGKELLLLVRDRSFLCQTVVLPVLICLFQLVLNRRLVLAATRSPRHVAALAFGTGAYVLLASSASLLVSEIRGLWMLYSLPERLESLLVQKVKLWVLVGVVFSAIVLGAAGGSFWRWDLRGAFDAALALLGVGIVGAVSAGVAVLATDVGAERPRVASTGVLLSMLLAGLYVAALYANSIWPKLIIVTLFVLVAFAVWQKVRDRIGYLLDPTERPGPQLGLSDGLIAAFAFFAVQSILFAALAKFGLETLDLLVLTYAAAGLLVAPASLLIFWRRKIPKLLYRVGLLRDRSAGASSGWWASAARGLAWGLAAGAVGSVYLMVVEHVEPLRQLKQQTPLLAGAQGNPLWVLVAAILVAPLLEEYLFRGLLYRGMARSFGPAVAIAGSSAVFAVLHPPIALVPVFGLGVAAAICFRRTGLLIAPVAAHVTYNLVVLAAGCVLQLR